MNNPFSCFRSANEDSTCNPEQTTKRLPMACGHDKRQKNDGHFLLSVTFYISVKLFKSPSFLYILSL